MTADDPCPAVDFALCGVTCQCRPAASGGATDGNASPDRSGVHSGPGNARGHHNEGDGVASGGATDGEREHTDECYRSGCTTGTHPAPRPDDLTSWIARRFPGYTLEDVMWDEALVIDALTDLRRTLDGQP